MHRKGKFFNDDLTDQSSNIVDILMSYYVNRNDVSIVKDK